MATTSRELSARSAQLEELGHFLTRIAAHWFLGTTASAVLLFFAIPAGQDRQVMFQLIELVFILLAVPGVAGPILQTVARRSPVVDGFTYFIFIFSAGWLLIAADLVIEHLVKR